MRNLIHGITVAATIALAAPIAVAEVETGVVDLGDTPIESFSEGEGDAIVLLSGRGLDVGYLSALSGELAEAGYRAIRITRRGAGQSVGDLENLTYHIHADDVAGVLGALDVSEASIFGHAIGNRIAQAFADSYPERAISVLLAPAAGPVQSAPEVDAVTGKMFAPGATDEEIAPGMAFMVGYPANSAWVWDVIRASQITDPASLRAETTVNEPLEDWGARPGPVPFLIMQGMKDQMSPPENAANMKERLGERATLVEFPDSGSRSGSVRTRSDWLHPRPAGLVKMHAGPTRENKEAG